LIATLLQPVAGLGNYEIDSIVNFYSIYSITDYDKDVGS